MEIAENNKIFKADFNIYKSKFDELKELTEHKFSNSLRQFDIRFRLALSLQIGFDNNISYTKSETTRKIYSLILKLNDLWFAYEGLYKLCEENSHLKSNARKSDPFTSKKVTELLLDNSVDNFGNYFKKNIYLNTRLQNDLMGYLQYCTENSTTKTQKKLFGSLRLVVSNNQFPKFNQILSLIYGIRNMYVHNTDTAKSGVSIYKTKIVLLKNCNDFLILSNLRIAHKILNEKINSIE